LEEKKPYTLAECFLHIALPFVAKLAMHILGEHELSAWIPKPHEAQNTQSIGYLHNSKPQSKEHNATHHIASALSFLLLAHQMLSAVIMGSLLC